MGKCTRASFLGRNFRWCGPPPRLANLTPMMRWTMRPSCTSLWQKLLHSALKALCCLTLTLSFSRPLHSWCGGNVCLDPDTCCGASGCFACCVPTTNKTKCDDGDECTNNDHCENGACVGDLLRRTL